MEHSIHCGQNRSLHRARTAEYMEEIDFIPASGYLFGVTIKNARGYTVRIACGSSYFISLQNVMASDSTSTASAAFFAFFLWRRRAQNRWAATLHSI
jgi:hypothetical protein